MEFVFPCERVLDSYREAYAEDIAANKGELQMLIHPDIAIARSEAERSGEDLPAGYVPATTLWLVEGDRFIGRVNIRHRLSPGLLRFGGHIGYTIRPSEQGKGYGKLQLAMALD
ncbi:MAG: GNAT family N-acetyltransferase, partial [Firmicutes bacterium]|nr:GNAT family N-acetyltransferase [Bacillota bacterium]